MTKEVPTMADYLETKRIKDAENVFREGTWQLDESRKHRPFYGNQSEADAARAYREIQDRVAVIEEERRAQALSRAAGHMATEQSIA